MRNLIVVTLAMAAAATSSAALAQTPAKPNPALATDLSNTFKATYGQEIAVYIQAVMPSFMKLGEWDAPVVVGYDRDENVISIVVFGSRTTIDSAKQSMDDFRTKVLPGVITMAKEVFGFDLDEKNFEVVYIRKGTNKPLLVFKNGNYTL